MPILHQLLDRATARGLPRIDAQMLLAHACARDALDRAWLLAHDHDEVPPEHEAAYESAMIRRSKGEPVAYIVGFKEFFGLRLRITPDVLDPRADTETLVAWALELIPLDRPVRVLDLGTGSGAIALALQAHRPRAQITATDVSSRALDLAQANAQELRLPIRFVHTDPGQANWFASLGAEQFDLIVSNPPYIAQGDPHLDALQHEPAIALTSGPDGLDAIRSIISNSPPHLTQGAWLLLEHGHDQAAAVRTLLATQQFAHLCTRRDLSAVDRCTGGQKLSS